MSKTSKGEQVQYVKVKVYAMKERQKLVELPNGQAGLINEEGAWVQGPLPLAWSKLMLLRTLNEWPSNTWSKWGWQLKGSQA